MPKRGGIENKGGGIPMYAYKNCIEKIFSHLHFKLIQFSIYYKKPHTCARAQIHLKMTLHCIKLNFEQFIPTSVFRFRGRS